MLRTSVFWRIAAIAIVIGVKVAVAAPVVIETVIAEPETKAETPVAIEVTARPGKVLTCKAVVEAAEAAAHMATSESAPHMGTTAAAHMTAAAARKRVSGQSPCESGGCR